MVLIDLAKGERETTNVWEILANSQENLIPETFHAKKANIMLCTSRESVQK